MAATPYRIVVGIDFSELATRALEEAMELAQRRQGELHVVAVVESAHGEFIPSADRHQSFVQITDHVRTRLDREAGAALRAFQARSGDGVTLRAIAHVRVGHTAEQLTALAVEIGADLVVVGTHGRRGMQRLVMGSVAEKTVRLAPCPVLVVRPKDTHGMQGLPAMEPACVACIAAREKSEGAQWWCAAHTSDPEAPHIYSRSYRLDTPLNPAPFGSS